jgi:hypothetical protein
MMRFVAGVAFAILTICSGAARADKTDPWAVGVSDAQKAEAQKLLEEGNALFLEKKYADALQKYQAATKVWDHPAIRFNIVRCLIQLDRPVEASDNLALALKYGSAPMDELVYSEALNYQKLLANQIGELDVRCEQAGVALTLDGQKLMTCPGKEHRRLAPGEHQIVGSKDGFLTKTTEVIVLGGKAQDTTVALVPLSKAAKVVHRWPAWQPWAVFGGGLALAGLGGLIQLQAISNRDEYDKTVARDCAVNGCAPGQIDMGLLNTATRDNHIAIAVMSVGAAAAITGGVMLVMNRGRTVYEEPAKRVDVAVTRGGGVVTVGGRF